MFDQSKGSSGQGSSAFDWKAFREKTWVIILAGIAFPPAGMVLAWLKPGWTARTKWIAIALMGVVLIGRIRARNDFADDETVVRSGGGTASRDDDRSNADYKAGYRYARGILEAAKRAPPSAKRKVMKPLMDLAAEAERGVKSKPRLFYKGVAAAMSELLDEVIKDVKAGG